MGSTSPLTRDQQDIHYFVGPLIDKKSTPASISDVGFERMNKLAVKITAATYFEFISNEEAPDTAGTRTANSKKALKSKTSNGTRKVLA